jgi:hypothetical protein
VLATSRVLAGYFFIPLTFGLAVLFLDEARKWCVRRVVEGRPGEGGLVN